MTNYADYSGKASKPEYWWFFLAVLLTCAAAYTITPVASQIIGIITVVPLLAVGSRRLNDTGHSGWWQLLFLVPFAQVVVFIMLAQHGKE